MAGRNGAVVAAVGLCAAVVVALFAVPAARGHAVLSPATLSSGSATDVAAEIPNEREGRATTGVTLSFPAGFVIESVGPVEGWSVERASGAATWTGGRIAAGETETFTLRVRATAPAGTHDVTLDQRYDDGAVVPTATRIVVLPASGANSPSQHVGRAIAAAVVGVLVVGWLVALRRLRRRPPDRSDPA